ncbi:MAG: type II/IV secretion system ATPase subunit, partial [Vulcanisaeta sp.]
MESNKSNEVTEVLEEYEVVKGLVHVMIYKETSTGLFIYKVFEPAVTQKISEAILDIRKFILNNNLISDLDNYGTSSSQVKKAIDIAVRRLKLHLTNDEVDVISYYLIRDTVGYGKIDPLVMDGFIEDIHVNGPNRPVYVWHSKYENLKTNIVLNESELNSLIVKISQRVGKNVNSAQPVLEGLLPDGLRVEIALTDVVPYGPIVTIRKFRAIPLTVIDLVSEGVVSAEIVALLWFLLEHGVSMIIIGPTGAGKTTLLNALLFLIRPESRIVTVEDTRELNIPHEQWVALVTRESNMPDVANIDMYSLVKLSMRIRPDYLVIGELRGDEAYVFFQAMASGHIGLTTIHAGSIDAAIRRLISKPMSVPRALLPMASIFIQIGRVKLGNTNARRILSVAELLEVKGDRPITNPLYVWNKERNTFERIGESKTLHDLISSGVITGERVSEELERRRRLIEAMVSYGFRSPEIVFRITRNYYV